MPKFIVREVCAYEVEAETMQEAREIFLADPDAHFVGCYDRSFCPAEEVVYGDGGPYGGPSTVSDDALDVGLEEDDV